jgi:hypothetical protein
MLRGGFTYLLGKKNVERRVITRPYFEAIVDIMHFLILF